MSDLSWFKVYRKDFKEFTFIERNIIWELCARARYNGNLRDPRLGIDLDFGQFVFGYRELAARCRCSVKAVYDAVKKLHAEGTLRKLQGNAKGTTGFIGEFSRLGNAKETLSSTLTKRKGETNLDKDLETEKELEHIVGLKPSLSLVSKEPEELEPAKKILEEFNRITEKSLRPVDGNLKWIRARLAESSPPSFYEISKMIQLKNFKWKDTEMKRYIRPETLFGASKFDVYIQEARDALKSSIGENKLFGVAEDAI